MANNTRKISELSSKGIVPESALLPVAVAGAEKETYRTTLNNLRANLLFENAYETLAEGIAATVKDEIFYVYTDDSQFYVTAFTNVNGASATALYKDNTPVIYGTGKMMADGKFGSYTSYVSYLYNNGSANGGETEIALPFDCFDVSEMFLNGGHQFKGLNYTFDRLSNKVKLKGPLTAGAFVVFYVRPYPGTPVTPVEPGITDYVNVTWLYNDGAAVGGETSLTPPWTFSTVPAIYINGSKQVLNKHYEVDSTGLKINLSKALKANDVVEVLLGGSRSIITAQVSGTPAEILLTLGQTTGATKVNTSYGVSLEQVVQGFYGVNSFVDLRNRRPNFEGEKVNLKGYYSGSTSGGGQFIGYIGTGTDDGGTVAAGSGFYWKRSLPDHIAPEMFGATGDGVTDDTIAVSNSIKIASELKLQVRISTLFAISDGLTVPANLTITGFGKGTGFIFNDAPTTQKRILYLNSPKVTLENFSILFKTGGRGAIDTIMVYGVFVDKEASYCTIDGLFIHGRYNETTMGFSNGIRLTGNKNKVINCNIEYCSMGMTARGNELSILNNYFSNHFVDENYTSWTSSLPFWDGIAMEGVTRSKIIGNTCEYNGQSGIYLGGGATDSLSYDNIISSNRVEFNANHGIDMGVSGTVTATKDVHHIDVTGNISRNNRYNQIWGGTVHHIVIVGNHAIIDDNHFSKFNATGDSSGIYLKETSNENIVSANNIEVTTNQYKSLVVLGSLNVVGDNRIKGQVVYFNNVLSANSFKGLSGSFAPTLATGTDTAISVTSSTGYYEVINNRVTYLVDMTISGAGATGKLILSPPIYSGSTVLQYDATCTFDSGFSTDYYTNKNTLNVYYSTTGITVTVKNIAGNAVDIGPFLTTSTRIRLRIEGIINNPSWTGYYN